MSSAITASDSADTTTFTWRPTYTPVETHDLFDAVVIGANELELRPRSELAKFLLNTWLGGEVQRTGKMQSNLQIDGSFMKYGAGFKALNFKFSTRPMLCSGDDPYFTGMTISEEEQQACRKFVEEMRAAKRPKVRTARRRRPR